MRSSNSNLKSAHTNANNYSRLVLNQAVNFLPFPEWGETSSNGKSYSRHDLLEAAAATHEMTSVIRFTPLRSQPHPGLVNREAMS